MPSFVTARDRFRRRGVAGVRKLSPANPRRAELSPANPRRVRRVIHMLINDLGMHAPRYLLVTIAGGGWNLPGGGWNRAEIATPRHFDLVNPQVTHNRRGLAGVGGGCFGVFTSENPDKAVRGTEPHVFANRAFSTPANPRRTPVPIFCSRGATTKVGA